MPTDARPIGRQSRNVNEVVSRTVGGVPTLPGKVSRAVSEALSDGRDISRTIGELDSRVRRIVGNIDGIAREVSRFRA